MRSYASVLPSGLRLVAYPLPARNMVSCVVAMHGGSDYESPELNGFSHMLEHARFLGTKRWPTEQEIAETVESVGGMSNAVTNEETIRYYITIPGANVRTAIDVLAEMLIKPRYPKENFNTERNVVLEEIRADQDNAYRLANDRFEYLIYGEHPAGRPVGGTVENIKKFSYDMIQKMAETYPASAVTVALVGDIPDPEDLLAYAQDAFGEAVTNRPLISKVPLAEHSLIGQASLIKKPFEQSVICLGARTVPRGCHHALASQLLSVILGGNSISRFFHLFRRVHGIAYSAYTYSQSFSDRGDISTIVLLDPSNVQKAISIIAKEYRDIAENGVSAEELNSARKYLLGTYAHTLDGTLTLGSYLAEAELFGLPKSLSEICENLAFVDTQDIRDVAQRYLRPENLAVVVVGNHKGRTSTLERQFESLLA